ncbi:MAG TPA: hypothetical protein V6C58_24570 [Allocoleopsis sp.]
MSVQNGQNVNAAVTNAAFVSKTTDSTSTAKLTLNKASEGAQVESVQKAVNKIYEGLGTTGQDDATINDYANSNFIADGDSRKVAIEKLDAQAAAQQAEVTAIDDRVTDLELNDMTIAGNKTFSDNVIIDGDLTVNGTTTTVNSTVLEVTDPNIIINNNGNDATSEGAGLTVERTGTNGSIVYQNSLASKFKAGDLGSEQELVTTGHTQTLTNKTLTAPSITNYQTNTEITTPAIPGAGTRRMYAKSDGFYEINSAGVESKFQTGAGSGANTTLSNLTSPTAINQDLLQAGGKSLGSPAQPWFKVAANEANLTFIRTSTDSKTVIDVDNSYLNAGGAPANKNGPVLDWADGNVNIPSKPNDSDNPRELKLYKSTFYSSIKASASLSSNTLFELPTNNGSAGYYLRNIGGGVTQWARPVYVQATNGSGQAINNGVATTITNWTENIDNYNAFNPTTGIFTAPEGGFYLVYFQIAWADSTSAGDRVGYILKNGSIVAQDVRAYENRGSGQNHQSFMILTGMAIGDTYSFQGLQSSGGTQNLSANVLSNRIVIVKMGT